MFKLKFALRDPEPGQSGQGAAPNNTPTSANSTGAGAPAPVVDIQAQINAALATQQAEFNAQFKEATGHDDLKAFTEAQLKAQGKLQELADANKAEAQGYKTKYEAAAISTAILGAASDAVDPTTVQDLLAGKAKVDESGNVTIDGKPVTDAVKALLEAKPFLAKVEGGTGSGTPANVNNQQTKTRAQFQSLSPAEQSKFCKDGGKVTD